MDGVETEVYRSRLTSGGLFVDIADPSDARVELERALDQAATIRFTVEETVDEVLFTRERNPVYPTLQVDEPASGEVAGNCCSSGEIRRLAIQGVLSR